MKIANSDIAEPLVEPSILARRRMLGVRGEPLFYADWLRVVFLHFEVDAVALQREVPFELDLHEGSAYLSLVAFTMRGMRPRVGGKLGAFLLRPIASHGFLNVRAYVRHRGEPGIHFLAEWLSNPLSVRLGPFTFGLPYRFGRLQYDHQHECGKISGRVADKSGSLEYRGTIETPADLQPCTAGSLDEFLLERYTAFTVRRRRQYFFRIWHPAWPQSTAEVEMGSLSLLMENWPWFKAARFIGGNYSPGVCGVWMGRPQRA